MNKDNKLELIRMAACYLRDTKSTSCKNFRILSQDPLFRGICYGSNKMNISPEEVEQEVSKILKFDTSLNKYKTDNSKSFASAPAEATAAVHIDGIMRQIMKFNPDEVSRLPIEVQKKIMNQWVIFEKGVIQARQMEFDSAYGEAMKTVNTKVLKKVSAALAKKNNEL